MSQKSSDVINFLYQTLLNRAFMYKSSRAMNLTMDFEFDISSFLLKKKNLIVEHKETM